MYAKVRKDEHLAVQKKCMNQGSMDDHTEDKVPHLFAEGPCTVWKSACSGQLNWVSRSLIPWEEIHGILGACNE